MYRRIFDSQSNTIVRAAWILSGASFVSAVFGLLRDRLLAGKFGAGDDLDIYYAAFRIPDFVSMVLVMGAISAAIIPIFSSYLTKSQKEAWEYFSKILNLFLFFLILISIILIIFLPKLFFLVAPGFSGEKRETAMLLTRIMFLSPILLGISNVISGALRVFRRFLVTSVAPIMYNLGIIFGIIFFVPRFGLAGLAWGVVFGAFLHLLIQLPILFKLGFKPKLDLNFSHPGIWETVKLTIPRAIGLAAGQINLIIVTAVGSTLSAGSIAVFNLSNNLERLPINLIGVTFSSAAFPFLASYFSQGRNDKLKQETSLISEKMLFLMVPASLLIFILRAQIVRIILGTGKFAWVDTRLTAACLGVFSFGILAYSFVLLLSKIFYAIHDTKTPALASLVSMVVNIIFVFLFVWIFSLNNFFQQAIINFLDIQGIKESAAVIGLPMAISLSGIFQFLLLLAFLKNKGEFFDFASLRRCFLKVFLASAFLAVFSFLFLRFGALVFDTKRFLGIFFQAVVSASAGITAYILVSRKLGLSIKKFLK
ncbi:MAG TPA: murein biosynthesis integral membrane protein MurJ [Candidatus Parcubacteria bacterium]|nr:murein biosynthesis integral membrane protein MurJ [Candidatus Parcubacteria bacterium]